MSLEEVVAVEVGGEIGGNELGVLAAGLDSVLIRVMIGLIDTGVTIHLRRRYPCPSDHSNGH